MQKQVPIVLALAVNDKNEILICKRRDREFSEADGKWEFAGGHIEFGENPEDAVVREVLEESGLEVKVVKLLDKVFTNFWKNEAGDEIQTFLLTYVCKVTGGELKIAEKEKISELKFIKPEEIEKYQVLPKILEITELYRKSLSNPIF